MCVVPKKEKIKLKRRRKQFLSWKKERCTSVIAEVSTNRQKQSSGRNTSCVTEIMTLHHRGEVCPGEKCQRCSVDILCAKVRKQELSPHSRFHFHIAYHIYFVRCSSEKSRSLITPQATGTTEDLRVGAVMGRVFVSMHVHVCACAQLPLLQISVTILWIWLSVFTHSHSHSVSTQQQWKNHC